MQDSMRALAALAAFSTSITWAYASARYTEAAARAGGVRVNLLRALTATLLWGGALLIVEGGHALREVSATRGLLLAASIACSYGFGDGLFFAAGRRLGVSSALAIAAIYPLWAALYGTLVRDEPFGPLRMLGLSLCIGGVAALMKLGAKDGPGALGARELTVGVLLSLATSLCWAGNAVFLKLGAEGISMYQANALRYAFGALLLLAQLPFKREQVQPDAKLGPLARGLALPLFADVAVGSVCFIYGVANSDLVIGTTLTSLSPLVALPVAAVLRTERLTPGRVLAVTGTVLGVLLLVLG